MPRTVGLAIVILGVAACSQSATEPVRPLPTPFPEIATTPSLQQWTVDRILAFRDAQESQTEFGFGLQVLALPAAAAAAERKEVGLVVTPAEPPGDWFVTPLGRERIALITNTGNRVRDLSSDEIARIFSGRLQNWLDVGGQDLSVQPIIPQEGDELRAELQRVVMGNLSFTPAALLGPSPGSTLSLVQEHPGAIGVVPLSAISDEVRILSVGGQNPIDSQDYPLYMEILAWGPAEPEGVVRDWLIWLQSQ